MRFSENVTFQVLLVSFSASYSAGEIVTIADLGRGSDIG